MSKILIKDIYHRFEDKHLSTKKIILSKFLQEIIVYVTLKKYLGIFFFRTMYVEYVNPIQTQLRFNSISNYLVI